MGCSVNFLQLPNRDLGVDLRCLQVRVAEHLLDEANVSAGFERQCKVVSMGRCNKLSKFFGRCHPI